MCSELFRIPVEAGGWPILGVGLLLAIWCTVGAVWIVIVGRSTNWSAEAWSYLPAFVVVGLAIALIPRLLPSGMPIRGYGVMVLCGAMTGLWLATHRARQVGISAELIYSLAFSMFLCGIIGARLFYVIEYWDARFRSPKLSTTLLEIVKFTEGGLVVYGSLIGASLAFIWFCRRQRLPMLALADLIAPSLVAGLALGRIGCLLNGCCYGGETDLPWGVTFPQQSPSYLEQASTGRLYGMRLEPSSSSDPTPVVTAIDPGSVAEDAGLDIGDRISAINGHHTADLRAVREVLLPIFGEEMPIKIQTGMGNIVTLPSISMPPRGRPIHPTQVYSSINAALLAWLLWAFYPFRRWDGEVTVLMLTLYPIARFLLEDIRIDESPVFGTVLSISQNISIVVLACAVLLWLWISKHPKGQLAFGTHEQN